MARKKVVLVIVEGPSDDTALGIGLSQVFDKNTIYIHIMHGDITTKDGINSANIVSKIGNVVREYAKSQHYRANDFKQIIHIVDTDGAFIPDEKIFGDADLNEVIYDSDGIYTVDVESIKGRNVQKRDNLYKLRTQRTIWNIPYRVYYMSCNLDHVLYDKRNSSDDEKESDAYKFARAYKGRKQEFIDFLCGSIFSVNVDYKKSWEFIEREMNSIERHTNICICIKEEAEKQE